jgi:hypothetical protein
VNKETSSVVSMRLGILMAPITDILASYNRLDPQIGGIIYSVVQKSVRCSSISAYGEE